MVIPKSLLAKVAILLVIIGMSLYPIYTSFYNANAVEHYERHQAHLQKNSMFFNPWQYRVLCPLIIEGMYWVADHTLFAAIEIKGIDLQLPGDTTEKNQSTQKFVRQLNNPEFIKYNIVFVGFRILQNLAITFLCFHYFNHFSKNNFLLTSFAIMLGVLFMGNGVIDADFTFNTYMEIIFYLLAALVIVKNLSPFWIALLTALGAANRETSVFIPILYFFYHFSWQQWPSISKLLQENKKPLAYSVVSTVLFLTIIFSIRSYYGYQPVSSWRVGVGLPMLKLNLFSAVSVKTYMELFGVLGILPLITIFGYKHLSPLLKVFLLSMIPAWFILHFAAAISYQTRLFLVPTIIVFIPAMIELINHSFREKKSHQTADLLSHKL